nr:late histone H2B.L4-like [Rhipicephalus microplus]
MTFVNRRSCTYVFDLVTLLSSKLLTKTTKMEPSAEQQQAAQAKGGKTVVLGAAPTVSATDGAKKRRRRRRHRREGYSHYICKVLKQVHPDLGISGKARTTMNSFVVAILDRIGKEAAKLSSCSNDSTITARDIQTVTRLLRPGELARHAVSEGTEAVSRYTSSQPGLPPPAPQQ